MTVEIDLWLWPLDQPGKEAGFARLLSDDEQARAARFVRPGDQSFYTVGRGRMREILAGYLGASPEELSFSYGAKGKPSLGSGPVFNLSHAGGWAALVVAPGSDGGSLELGVDIEAERRIEEGVASRYFSEREYATLCALPKGDWAAGFFRCWTRKEAVIKAAGTGLSTPLDSFDVTLAPGDPARIERVSGDLAPVEAWALVHLDLAPGLVGAVAVVAYGRDVQIHVREGSLPVR